MQLNLGHWLVIYTAVVTVCSYLHSFLPPWDAEAFQPFPTFVKFYKVFIYVLGYAAVNARSTVYPSISIAKSGGVNESVVSAETPKEVEAPKP